MKQISLAQDLIHYLERHSENVQHDCYEPLPQTIELQEREYFRDG
jgi:hypothetical protein